jgi:hypothetical protein
MNKSWEAAALKNIVGHTKASRTTQPKNKRKSTAK